MAHRKPYTGAAKLILAFNIGTTFSGISYCILEQGQVAEVFSVTKFPGQPPVDGDAKVPSLLYYDKNGNVRAAGAEVLTEGMIGTALQEDWTRAESWKLHLRPKYLASSIDAGRDVPPLPSGKSPIDVLTDFIKYLFHHAKTYITEHHLDFPWTFFEDSIEYIFTHPNSWECVRHVYLEAIERAGLIPNTAEGRSRVYMLTEGEAALCHCVANSLNPEAVDQTNPRGVVIIDAGVATIDLRMFSITVEPTSWKEIAPAESLVTHWAKVSLQGKPEGWEHPSSCEIAEITREFDRTGLGLDTAGVFGETTDAIIVAFEKQQKSATMPITVAFLVGELSANSGVLFWLQSYFTRRNINIHRPDGCLNKIVASGAVLAHINRDDDKDGLVSVLPIRENDKERIRKKGRWEIDPIDDLYPPGHFKSDLHPMVFRQSFSLTTNNPKDVGMQTVRIEYFRRGLSDQKEVDRDQSSFSTLCTVSADLSGAIDDLVVQKTASGEVYYQLDYEVIVLFSLTALQAQVGWKTEGGERRIPATVL